MWKINFRLTVAPEVPIMRSELAADPVRFSFRRGNLSFAPERFRIPG